LLWYKSQYKEELKALELIQGMANFKERELLASIASKKSGVKFPIKAILEFKEIEEEMLNKHMKYFY
jgi:hypothetical protein